MTEQSGNYKADDAEKMVNLAMHDTEIRELNQPGTDGFGNGPGRNLVLGELGLSCENNEVALVRCKVEQFTVEAKVQPASYEQARGYVSLVPENLWIHVPVTNPGRYVNNGGDAELFAAVYRRIARQLDLAVFQVASERVDRRTVIADEKAARKGGVKIGKAPQKQDDAVVL